MRTGDDTRYQKRRHDLMMEDMGTKIIKLENDINLKNSAIDLLNKNTVHDLSGQEHVNISQSSIQAPVISRPTGNSSDSSIEVERSTIQPPVIEQSPEHLGASSVDFSKSAGTLLKDGFAEYLTFYEKNGGRQYTCGVFISAAALKALLALNRGNEEYKSAKFDSKFASTLINDICGPHSSSDEHILRNFVNGEHFGFNTHKYSMICIAILCILHNINFQLS